MNSFRCDLWSVRVFPALLLLSLRLVSVPVGTAAEPLSRDWAAEHYTKHEYRIRMRDGVKLFTVVFTPKERSIPYPILLSRTPYGLKPYTVDATAKPPFPDSYLKEKFILVSQDVRGRFASEGTFVDVRPQSAVDGEGVDESTDAWDTIDWLVKNVPNNNGNVGLQGISYLGFFAAAGMINSHPALKAVSPQAPAVDIYNGDDVLHNGAFWLVHNFGFFSFFEPQLEDPLRQEPRSFDFKTPDGYEFFLNAGPTAEVGDRYFKGKVRFWDSMAANINEAAWTEKHNLTKHLRNVRAAVLTVGGWFDAEDLSGTLKTYRATEENNPGIYNGLVMGPWVHGGWHFGEGESLGPIKFHAKTAEFFRDQIEMPFWRKFLKGQTNTELAEAYVFETGNCEWRKEAAWPPRNAARKSFFLGTRNRLLADAPGEEGPNFDEYMSDPGHPVPFTAAIDVDMPTEYMVEDQRFASRRPDVLVYQTEPLMEEVTVAGPVNVTLFVSTSGTDSDFVVKLIDVYSADHPSSDRATKMGHYQQLVRGEPMRGKYRHGYGKPEPFEPNAVTKLEWSMPDICHTFRPGHRLMVQVQSSWFPLMDRNPQTFCNIYRAKPDAYVKATQRVYHKPDAASAVSLLLVPGRQ